MRGQMAKGLSSVRNHGTRNSKATATLTTATASRPRSKAPAASAGTKVASHISWKISPRWDEARTAK